MTREGWYIEDLVKDQVHIMARTAQISKEKRQSIITLKHEGQSKRKMSVTFKVYSSADAKTIKIGLGDCGGQVI